MDHAQVLELLPAYLDQELDLSVTLELERHLQTCDSCRQACEAQGALSAQVRAAGLRVEAPLALLQRIEAALPGPAAANPAVNPAAAAAAPAPAPAFAAAQPDAGASPRRAALLRPRGWAAWRSRWALNWAGAGALAVSVAVLAVSANLYVAQQDAGEQRLAQEVVDGHIRSLQANHLSDVISTDKHTVKPWFNGRLDYAPPVIDLAAQGYPLIGGRLDVLQGRSVAVLVYRYKLHPINLYVWPGKPADTLADAPPQIRAQQGYHLAHWSAAGVNYWAITDAGVAELGGFVSALRAQAGS
jgi:anti-sigma factor RsiW